ncbi:MAG: (2Fe-2S) ferredoxin domain-containing protein [Magnetococcales bacterium]|nr:(2Fe-2S) ferredoxin domain-containing protein [Magnetococcales bacterium]
MDDSFFYDIHIFCCVNQRVAGHPRGDCASRGSIDLHAYLKERVKSLAGLGRVRVNQAGCLDRCELGPVLVIYPQGTWYHYRSRDDIDEIVSRHLQEGQLVTRLVLRHDASRPPVQAGQA